jgi:hypothetical protein
LALDHGNRDIPGRLSQKGLHHIASQKRVVCGCHQNRPVHIRAIHHIQYAGRNATPAGHNLCRPAVRNSLSQGIGHLRQNDGPVDLRHAGQGAHNARDHRLSAHRNQRLPVQTEMAGHWVWAGSLASQDQHRPTGKIIGHLFASKLA